MNKKEQGNITFNFNWPYTLNDLLWLKNHLTNLLNESKTKEEQKRLKNLLNFVDIGLNSYK